MSIKLIKVCKELNIGISTAVEFCKNQGTEMTPDPNAYIADDLYMLMANHFSKEENMNQEGMHSAEKQRTRTSIIMGNGMEYQIGDRIKVRINKIQDNGCFCSFHPFHSGLFGFMPEKLMRSLIGEQGNYSISVGDNITVVIWEISERGFLLSDIETYEREREKALLKCRIEKFAAEYTHGDVFEAEVVEIYNKKVIIKIGNITGVIRKEDTEWNEIDRLENLLFVGEQINAVYIKYENEQLFFSLKLLNEKPYDERLYDLSAEALLKFVGHDSAMFIGQAKRYSYGLFIENLYSADKNQRGKLLIDPFFGYNLRALVQNANFYVEENKYYKIELKLVPKDKRIERNQLFQFVAVNIVEAENPYKADVNLTFSKSTSPRDCTALAHTLAEVGKNMYSSKDRMFFELVQNADDAAAQKGVYVNVQSKGDYLIVRHNGNSFDKDDFDAITSSANGTKKANENKTGYKGIGFKSVFTDSEIVFIKTGGYQFKFDRNEPIFANFEQFYFTVNNIRTEQERKDFLLKFSSERNRFRGVEDIPWQLEPIWVDEFPQELGEDFVQSNVAIALKLGEFKITGDNGYNKAIETIVSNPRFMLFLRNTKRIDFNGVSVNKSVEDDIITLKNSFAENKIEYFRREDFEIAVNNEVFENSHIDIRIHIDEQDDQTGKIIEAKFVDTHNQELENIPKKIAINHSSSISFAIPIDKDGELKPNMGCNEISMFAFLPTLVKDFRFPFYINANFILDPPRQRILGDNPWNFYLMQEIARCLVRWSASLNRKQDRNALNVLVSNYFEEGSADTKQLAAHFNIAYKIAIETEAFILNHKNEMVKQENIILDKTGLAELMGNQAFCDFIETDCSLPSSMMDSKILSNKIFEKITRVDWSYLECRLIERDCKSFGKWYNSATQDQQEQFMHWLVENKDQFSDTDIYENIINELPLFHFDGLAKSKKDIQCSDRCIITTSHIAGIKNILNKLGFDCSDNVFDESHPLWNYVSGIDEKALFDKITLAYKKLDGENLTGDEVLSLFIALKDFRGIGEKSLTTIGLFHNNNGEYMPLEDMIPYQADVPNWLNRHMICREENYEELKAFLIQSEDSFHIVRKHISELIKEVPLMTIYEEYRQEWDGAITRKIIDEYGSNGDILTIVEESDNHTKKYFLDKIANIELHSSCYYNRESKEFRILQLALSAYEVPSNFSPKIYYNGQCIKNFSVSDEVCCDYTQKGEPKKVKMSLAKLLPQYQSKSDSIEKIKGLFESKRDLDKFFDASPKPIDEVYSELNQLLQIPEREYPEWNVAGNAQQYLFSVYYRIRRKGWFNSFVPTIDLEKESESFVRELLDFLYMNGISVAESPVTNRLKKYFAGKYLDSDYVLENEKLLPYIEDWADNEKKVEYLRANGVRTEKDIAIQFRRLFLEDKMIDFLDKMDDDILSNGVEFIATAKGPTRPFNGVNQKKILLQLKNKWRLGLTDDWNIKKMENTATEWDRPKYKEWIAAHYPHIFIYLGALPRKLSYKEELLLDYEDELVNHYYKKEERKLFISKVPKIEDILFEVAKEGKSDFGFNDYKLLFVDEERTAVSESVLSEKNKEIEQLTERNQRNEDLLRRYREKYGDLPSGDSVSLNMDVSPISMAGIHTFAQDELLSNVIERDGLSEAEQINAHQEAMRVVMEKLEACGYNCSNWDFSENDEGEQWKSVNQVKDIISPSGESINLVIKSAKKGYIFLSATDFDYLTSNSNNVLMVWNGQKVHSVTAEDIFNKDSNVNLIFDTEYTPKHYYAALSKVFQYIKRTTFAVKDPSYNAFETIKTFGMDAKTEGVQELFDDNDL